MFLFLTEMKLNCIKKLYKMKLYEIKLHEMQLYYLQLYNIKQACIRIFIHISYTTLILSIYNTPSLCIVYVWNIYMR